MDETEAKPGTPRGRPRDPERERRVLVAAIEEYSERGWAGLTMDGVARRAGVGKSTIYLRWTNKEDLLAAAVQRLSEHIQPLDTGSVRGDIHLLVTILRDTYATQTGWGMVRILVDAAGGEKAVAELQEVTEQQRAGALGILERGVQRGELRPDVPGQLVINAIYGTMTIFRMMRPWDDLSGVAPGPEELVGQVVDFVMAGLGPYLTGAADA